MSGTIFMGRSDIFFPRPKIFYDIDQYRLNSENVQATGIIDRAGLSMIVLGNSRSDEAEKSFRGVHDEISTRIRITCGGAITFRDCFHGDKKCDCKFPGTALFEKAIEEFGLRLSECYMIAGSANEFNAAKAVGIENIVLVKKTGRAWSKKAKEFAVLECDTFREAAIFFAEVTK